MRGSRRGIGAAVVAALFVSSASAAGAQDRPTTGTLPSGLVYEIRADAAQPAAGVALWYRVPSGGFDPTPVAGLSRLAAATVAASTPVTGTPLAQLVERWGGRITISAYPDSVSITALVPADRAAQAVRAMTAVYFAPVATPAGLQVAKRDTAEEIVYRSFGPEAIEDALGATLFASGPLHDGTIGTAQGLRGVEVERVRAFAERGFRPSNAILVLTGGVNTRLLDNIAARPGSAGPPQETPAAQDRRPAATVLRRDGAIDGTGLGWIGPPITAEADATALDFLADALFAPKTGIAVKALGSRKATVTGRFVTFHDPGVFLVTITGEDAAAAAPIVRQVIAEAATPMDRGAFEAARAAFTYRLLSDLSTPAEFAETFGWYTVEGDAPYAPAEGGTQSRYFGLVAGLTPATVAAAAARYLGAAPGVVTLVKASSKAAPT